MSTFEKVFVTFCMTKCT